MRFRLAIYNRVVIYSNTIVIDNITIPKIIFVEGKNIC